MSNTDIFLEAIAHVPHKVFGFRLLPLSLFHLAMIDKYCPGVLNNGPSDATELKTAALICSSRNFEQFQRKAKGLRCYLSAFYPLGRQLERFTAYLADYMSFPECTSKGAKKESNNPFPFSLMFAGQLIKQTGYSFDTVFYDLNISQVFWLVSVMGYLDSGDTAIISDKEQAAYDALGIT